MRTTSTPIVKFIDCNNDNNKYDNNNNNNNNNSGDYSSFDHDSNTIIDPDVNFFNSITSPSLYYSLNEFPKMTAEFSIMHLNSRSLLNKLDDLEMINSSILFKFRAIAITETWLSENTAPLIKLEGYNFIYKNRLHKQGGGVGLFLNEHINAKIREDLCLTSDSCEWLAVEIIQNHLKFKNTQKSKNFKNIIIYVVYKPPNTNSLIFMDALHASLIKAQAKNNIIYLTGDFNIDILNDDCHGIGNDFTNMLFSLNFFPLITCPTRLTSTTATLIDNIFTNHLNKHCSGLLYSDISDHLPIFTLSSNKMLEIANNKKSDTFHNFKNSNILLLKNYLHDYDWTHINNSSNANEAFSELITAINNGINICCPVTKSKNVKKKQQWITNGLLKSINTKNSLYKKFLTNPCEKNKIIFINYRNRLNIIKRKAKKFFYTNQLNSYKNDIKKTWKLINQTINKCDIKSFPNLLIMDNKQISDPVEICNAFNNSFISTINDLVKTEFKSITPNNINSQTTTFISNPNSFFMMSTDENEIKNIVKKLKNSSCAGDDNISNSLLKHIIPSIATPLSMCINLSLNTGVFPNQLKTSKVIPIFKGGDRNSVDNYRPISLISSLSKVMEKIVYTRMIHFADQNGIISKNQFGFVKNCSTEQAILNLTQTISNNIDAKLLTLGVFLDISKAFDSINHELLLKKLYCYGMRGTIYNWLESYLANRNQYISLNSATSSLLYVQYGVPQGSILGPLLFLLFINDLVHVSKLLKCILYADDTTLLISGHDIKEMTSILNQELTAIQNWFNENHLKLNIKKSRCILFGPKIVTNILNFKLFLNNEVIPRVESFKFLGVVICSNLSWKNHINLISNKISKSLGIINRLKLIFSQNILKNLYYSLIYPYLNYCLLAWGNCSKTHLRCLTRCQNSFVRIYLNLNRFEHISEYFKIINILTIDQLFVIKSMLFLYKLINLNLFCVFNIFLPNLTNCVKQRSISIWNELPHVMKSCNHYIAFKRSLIKYIIKQ